jgi:phage terminase large subunit
MFMLVAHRRAGKTVAAISDTIERALYNTREAPRYGYVGPLLKQSKQIAWEYLKKYAGPYSPKINESELYVELQALPNKPRITIYGADNPDAFRGLYFDGVVLDEFGNMRLSTWREVLLPSLMDRRGWVVFMGTPNGPNHFRDMWYEADEKPGWDKLFLPVYVTQQFSELELAEMQAEMDPEEYAQEMLCSFEASVRGAVYARQMEEIEQAGRIGDFSAQRGLPVDVIADLGWRDFTVLGFAQERPDGVVLDRVYHDNFQEMSSYVRLIRDYYSTTGHKFGKLWLPHDAKATSLQTGKSTIKQFKLAGIRPKLVPELSIQDGISATRKHFRTLYMNRERCKQHILAMKTYHYRYDEDLKTYTKDPVHDWSSNFADMHRYMAIVTGSKAINTAASPQNVVARAMYEFSLDDLWETATETREFRL